MSEGGSPLLHLGGPDRPPRYLRDLLQNRIEAVPPGGEIVWATYYFRDRALARALMAASDRGVRVVLHVEGRPRRASANAAVIAMLSSHGLGGGLHVHMPGIGPHRHLHSKIYAFSHPVPSALVGSFNPSGDEPEDAEVIAELGDQDRGHNLLVELQEPLLVRALRGYVLGLSAFAPRFRFPRNGPVVGEAATAWFYPRLRTGIIDAHLARLDGHATIRGAISHLKHGALAKGLMRAASLGASVRLIVHDTARRVPPRVVRMLAAAGIDIVRYEHPEGLPIHAKILLIEEAGAGTAYFGSFNYNPRSRFLNHEALLATVHPVLFEGLAQRFEAIAAEVARLRGGS
jgi:hypothetical protein